MPTNNSRDPSDSEDLIGEAAPLSRWERLGASVAGVALTGSGAVAVFLTGNQAGCVALLLIGALLLVIAINGTPLVRARYQDYELLMARRRRVVAEEITQEPTAEARQALNILTTVDPGARRDPVVARASAAVYEREVVELLQRIFPEASLAMGPGDSGVDAFVNTENGSVGIVAKMGTHPLGLAEMRRIVTHGFRAPVDAILVVTNRVMTQSIERLTVETDPSIPVAAVRWLDHQDDDALRERMRALTSELQGRNRRPT